MNCTIPAQNTKVLCKAINSLAKVGDEIHLEAFKDKLTIMTLNMSKTVCAQCHFYDSFFSSYDVEENGTDDDKITCKLFMKSMLPLLKGNLEKKLEFLKIEYDLNSDFIVFKMRYKCGQILMIHKLKLMETEYNESLTIGISPNSGVNNLCASSTFFNQFLSMFNPSDSEVTLEISNSRVVARNYYPGAPSNPNLMRCEVKLSAGEFFVFDVKKETSINLLLKPLKTVISFADNFNLHVGLNFDGGGKPLTMVMKNPTFEIIFIISTLNPNEDMSSTLASTSLPTISQRNKKNLNITIEDQQALETENWDNVMILNESKKQAIRTNGLASSSRISFEETPENEQNSDLENSQPDSPRRKKVRLVFSRCYEPNEHLIPKINDNIMYDTISQ